MGWILACKALVLVVIATQVVPVMVWIERKASAFIQDRPGPERASIFGLRFAGLFHTLADVGKMITKEDVLPERADRLTYVLAPMIGLVVVLTSAAVIPLADAWEAGGMRVAMQVAELRDVGVLYVFAVSSLGVYGIILAGWASRSRYPLLGALRSAAQLVSYELPLGLAALTIPLIFGTLEPNALVVAQGRLLWGVVPAWGVVLQPVAFVIFLAAAFAETNRLPFDLPEGESEIVGFHVEYSSMSFGLFMMAEYIHIIVASALGVTLFLGGWQVPWAGTAVLRAHSQVVLGVLGALGVAVGLGLFVLSAKATGRGTASQGAGSTGKEKLVLALLGAALAAGGGALILTGAAGPLGEAGAATVAAVAQAACFGLKVLAMGFFFVWVRWTLPRFRYDQVMRLGWKQLLPLSLANLIVTAGLMALAAAMAAPAGVAGGGQ